MRLSPDRGSATVLMLGLVLATAVIGLGALAVGRALQAAHHAAAAADLAALAGAGVAVTGADPAQTCRAARAIASANGAALRECAVSAGAEVTVLVAVEAGPISNGGGLRLPFGAALARARAGPAPP